MGTRGQLGGDIYVHGDCVTIGCVPITNDGIEEVYWLAVEARAAGQTDIPVHIFPARLTATNVHSLEREFRQNPELLLFWDSLRPAFEAFEKNRRVPRVEIDGQGQYRVRE